MSFDDKKCDFKFEIAQKSKRRREVFHFWSKSRCARSFPMRPWRNWRKRVLDLEEQNRVLDAFIENSTDAIQISDRNLVTLRINLAYEVLTGIRREELVGVPVEQLVKNHLISESCGAIVAKTKKPHTIVQTFYRTGAVHMCPARRYLIAAVRLNSISVMTGIWTKSALCSRSLIRSGD